MKGKFVTTVRRFRRVVKNYGRTGLGLPLTVIVRVSRVSAVVSVRFSVN